MRTLVHLSDLHFGRTESQLVESIAAEVRAVGPDLLVVSGDLIQRARKDEFLQARAFLDSLLALALWCPAITMSHSGTFSHAP